MESGLHVHSWLPLIHAGHIHIILQEQQDPWGDHQFLIIECFYFPFKAFKTSKSCDPPKQCKFVSGNVSQVLRYLAQSQVRILEGQISLGNCLGLSQIAGLQLRPSLPIMSVQRSSYQLRPVSQRQELSQCGYPGFDWGGINFLYSDQVFQGCVLDLC